jgi:hypothetical protein
MRGEVEVRTVNFMTQYYMTAYTFKTTGFGLDKNP